MIRFVLKRETRDHNNDYASTDFFTVDGDVVAVEAWLRKGGSGPNGFDRTSLVGVELIDATSRTPERPS